MLFIGVDAHKATSQITVMDESGKVLKRQRVLSNPEGFRQSLSEFGHPGDLSLSARMALLAAELPRKIGPVPTRNRMRSWLSREMDEAQQIADRLRQEIPKAPRGTLRFWGEWFGRPYDNIHTLVSCNAEQNVLQLSFDGGETLFVWSPKGLTVDQSRFRISDAARVRWEWFYYGREKTPENRYFQDFTKSDGEISASTNVDWYTPVFHPTRTEPAVEIF